MAHFAYDDDPTHTVPIPPPARSQTRLRVPIRYASEMGTDIAELAVAVAAEDRDVVTYLRAVRAAAADVAERAEDLGATHITRAWLQACVEWLGGVTSNLVAAFSYECDEREVAIELAAEESSMKLLMGLEREGIETVSFLRNLDSNAARAAADLVATIDVADRVLHELTVRTRRASPRGAETSKL
ncbi:hypothetical protein BH09MYX1_BH09MYX1_41150 [soil metagenome]